MSQISISYFANHPLTQSGLYCCFAGLFLATHCRKGAFKNRSRGPYGVYNYMTQIAVFARRKGPGNDL